MQTAFLGDLLLSVPLMKKTKELWPEEPVILLCREKLGDLFLQLGLVDEVLEVRKGDRGTYRRATERLRDRGLARVICPHQSVRTALFVASLAIPLKIGFASWWNGFAFHRRVPRNGKLPDAIRQLSLLAADASELAENIRQYGSSQRAYLRDEEGVLSAPPSWASMSLREKILARSADVTRVAQQWGLSGLRGKMVLIFPGSVWATKRWTEEGFAEVGRRLREHGAEIFIMGARGEEEICSRVAGAIPGARNLCGSTSLLESAILLARADLLIGNDSASAHLASLAETPTIAIFGPTVIEFGFRPWADHVFLVEMKGLACRPCGPHGHRQCPRGTHDCMKGISPGDVLAPAEKILGSPTSPHS